MWGKSEHLTFKKKNPTSSLKTYLLGLETGSRIFGTTIFAKKTAKMQCLIILKQLGKILGVRIYPILRYVFLSSSRASVTPPKKIRVFISLQGFRHTPKKI
jgi:hypothetical protein